MTASLPDTIAAASRLIEARKLSPVELVEGLLARVAAIDPVINAFLTVTGGESYQTGPSCGSGDQQRRVSRRAAWHTVWSQGYL
jgi:Asp-tRNA(Asn)/Glu-tRNA(Gln) amidotransferase A subunit family amidase